MREHDVGCVIFTLPYYPTLQPSNMFWIHCENYVACIVQLGYTMPEAVAQLGGAGMGDLIVVSLSVR